VLNHAKELDDTLREIAAHLQLLSAQKSTGQWGDAVFYSAADRILDYIAKSRRLAGSIADTQDRKNLHIALIGVEQSMQYVKWTVDHVASGNAADLGDENYLSTFATACTDFAQPLKNLSRSILATAYAQADAQTMSRDEAAEAIGVSTGHISRLVKDGSISGKTVNSKLVIDRASVEAFRAKQQAAPTKPKSKRTGSAIPKSREWKCEKKFCDHTEFGIKPPRCPIHNEPMIPVE